MPRQGITAYDLLVSCPSDVLNCLDIIKDSTENFNRVFGVINNIEVTTKHWSTDSYPQSGDKPQELLNKQFVRDCDAAVAIFWTRFGSPTDKYGSGTEEEIEDMITAGKQVFMYFLDKEVSLSEVNIEQYNKVIDFKEKYKGRGIYFVVKNEQELQQQFTNHLGLYFLPLITKKTNLPIDSNQFPLLKIRDASNFVNDIFEVHQFSLSKSKFIIEKRDNIVNKIKHIQINKLPTRLPAKVEPQAELTEFQKAIQKITPYQSYQFGNLLDADISDTCKDTIIAFAKSNDIILEHDFWNVGELKKREPIVVLPFGGNGPTFEGADIEKERYDGIMDIYWDTNTFNDYIDYFSELDNKKYIKCVISNIGTTFDEDIDIKLIVEKKYVCNVVSIPVPGINIINNVNKNSWLDYFFTIKENENIDPYLDYPILPQEHSGIPPSLSMFNNKSRSEEYETEKRKYNKKINNIFCYRSFESNEYDVLCFRIKYLKHNTNIAFPSILLFNEIPSFIDYEISSKYVSNVIKGRIDLGADKITER